MKRLAFVLIASFACVQSSYAATSALTQSLREYDAIIDALGSNPKFEDVIPAAQFIVDIKRITPELDITGTVLYQIKAQVPDECGCFTYIAKLHVKPNKGIGPFITKVVSITEVN